MNWWICSNHTNRPKRPISKMISCAHLWCSLRRRQSSEMCPERTPRRRSSSCAKKKDIPWSFYTSHAPYSTQKVATKYLWCELTWVCCEVCPPWQRTRQSAERRPGKQRRGLIMIRVTVYNIQWMVLQVTVRLVTAICILRWHFFRTPSDSTAPAPPPSLRSPKQTSPSQLPKRGWCAVFFLCFATLAVCLC